MRFERVVLRHTPLQSQHQWSRARVFEELLKRLRVREERSAQMHLSFLRLGCYLILSRELERHLRDGP